MCHNLFIRFVKSTSFISTVSINALTLKKFDLAKYRISKKNSDDISLSLYHIFHRTSNRIADYHCFENKHKKHSSALQKRFSIFKMHANALPVTSFQSFAKAVLIDFKRSKTFSLENECLIDGVVNSLVVCAFSLSLHETFSFSISLHVRSFVR